MTVYVGIDLHVNNSVVAMIDQHAAVLFQKRYRNRIDEILSAFNAVDTPIDSVVVESTFNWYWLVDGLMSAGYDVRLCNPAKADRYDGLKYSDDFSDARWLAEMRRLGILPEGYIYPPAQRAVRDLLRRRAHLVRQRSALLLSTQNLMHRNTGEQITGQIIKAIARDRDANELLADSNLAHAIQANANVIRTLDDEVAGIEDQLKTERCQTPYIHQLKTVVGVGEILALTIALETGDITRFPQPGNYASYCRCVKSERRSNDKRKGNANRKAGNRYLNWAFIEAAHFARRYYSGVQRFYARKASQTNGMVAINAIANKLARASFYVMRDNVAFDIERAF